MNRGSVSRAVPACDLGGIRQNWPNRYAVTVTTALFLALAIAVLIGFSEAASADTRNLTSTADTQIAENSSSANYGGATTLKVDGDDPGGSGKDAASLLRWDLSSVPAGSKVDSASVTVNVTNPSSQTYQIYDLERPWVESAATWLQYASGSAWEVAGARGSLDRGSQVGSLSASTTGKRTFTLSPALVQRWLDNPASNQGIIIANSTNGDGVDFSSRQNADASLRPTLGINYTATTTPPPPTSRYLSDMNWISATNGWGQAEKDMSNGEQASGDGGTVTLNGATFQKGLGVHGASDVRYGLAGAYSTFSAKVGVDDEVGDRGSVVFEVWADGTMLYTSGVMNGASTTKDVRVDIRGKDDLRLVVTNASDGADFDHADWAGAMVDNSSPPPADTDGDSVTDDVDNCDTQPGPASNGGCPLPDPEPTSDEPNVCAHWHVAAQREVSGIDTPEELQPQFEAAREAGVECFALNVNGWDSNYQFNTNLVWTAANQWNSAHPGYQIYLYPSIDMASISSESTLEAISRHKYNDPARLRVDGGVKGDNLPVTQTWQGQNHFGGPSGWQRILNEEAAAGFPVFFMPMFDPGNAGMNITQMVDAYNGANNSSQSDDIVDGFYNFGGLASGDNSERGYEKNREWDNAIQASPGMDFQAGCAPHFNRHSDTGQFGNRIIGDFEGFHAFNKCMQGYAFEQKPRFMEFTTWNDYLEGSYLGVNYTQAQLPSRYDGNYLDHGAFRKVSRLYVNAYESGATDVAGTQDFVAIAHRPHLENASGVNGSTDSIGLPKQVDYSVVEDRLYAIVMLKTAGDIRLTSGGASQTFSRPAGVSEVSMPFAAGTQRIELVRNGATQLSATSAIPVTLGPVTLFNYNVATTYAEGA